MPAIEEIPQAGTVWYNWFVLIGFDLTECGSPDPFFETRPSWIGPHLYAVKPVRLRVQSFVAAKQRPTVFLELTDGRAEEHKLCVSFLDTANAANPITGAAADCVQAGNLRLQMGVQQAQGSALNRILSPAVLKDLFVGT